MSAVLQSRTKMEEFKSFPKPTKRIKIKKRLKREKKTPIAKLKRIADALAGEKCRARGVCQAKGHGNFKCTDRIQWCHIFSRRYQKLRWLPQNALSMCNAHHVYFTYAPNEWTMFLLQNYKETYEWLYREKEVFVKIDRQFLEKTILDLQSND